MTWAPQRRRPMLRTIFYPHPTGQVAHRVTAVSGLNVNMFLYTDGARAVAIDAGLSCEPLRTPTSQDRPLPGYSPLPVTT
jgi:hypothetical protein